MFYAGFPVSLPVCHPEIGLMKYFMTVIRIASLRLHHSCAEASYYKGLGSHAKGCVFCCQERRKLSLSTHVQYNLAVLRYPINHHVEKAHTDSMLHQIPHIYVYICNCNSFIPKIVYFKIFTEGLLCASPVLHAEDIRKIQSLFSGVPSQQQRLTFVPYTLTYCLIFLKK